MGVHKMSTEKKIPETAAETTTEPAVNAELEALLAKYGVEDVDAAISLLAEMGVDTVDDLSVLSDKELCDVGLKLAKARKLLEELKGDSEPAAAPAAAGATAPPIGAMRPMPQIVNAVSLPAVPSDESWLADLKTGGVLKCDQSSYVSAVRAAIADRLDMRSLPGKLCEMIKNYAIENDEPVPELYWGLRKQAKQREYSDIFAAIGGESSITEADRKTLIDRMKNYVLPAAGMSFYQISSWRKSWMDPSIALTTMITGMYGNDIPDTAAIRDSADDLRNAINRALSGVGPAAAATMACEYNRVKKMLNDPALPSYIGVTGRDQLLKKLGIDVGSNMIRAEKDLVQFILGVIAIDEQGSDNEVAYCIALYNLGSRINWAELGVSTGGPSDDNFPSNFTSIAGNRL